MTTDSAALADGKAIIAISDVYSGAPSNVFLHCRCATDTCLRVPGAVNRVRVIGHSFVVGYLDVCDQKRLSFLVLVGLHSNVRSESWWLARDAPRRASSGSEAGRYKDCTIRSTCLSLRASALSQMGLRPSQVCIAVASCRLPVRIMRPWAMAARTVSIPIQIAVMERKPTDT